MRRLYTFALALLLASSAFCIPAATLAGTSLLESAAGANASSSTQVITPAAEPTTGNILVVTIYAKGNATITPPSGEGWNTVTSSTGSTAEGYVFSLLVTSDNRATSYSFTLGTAEVIGYEADEWSGATTTGVQGSITRHTSTTTSYTTPTVTPSASSGQTVALMLYNSNTVTASVASGWTANKSTHGGNTTSIYSATDNTATTSGTGVSMASTLSTAETGISVTYIVYPAASSGQTVTRVQQVYDSGDVSYLSFTVTTPKSGDLLVVEMFPFSSSSSYSAPSGWTLIQQSLPASGDLYYPGVIDLYCIVGSGCSASTNYTFSSPATTVFISGRMSEFSGFSASSPIDKYSLIVDTSDTSSVTLPSVTPSLTGDFGLTAATCYITGLPYTDGSWTIDFSESGDCASFDSNASLSGAALAPVWTNGDGNQEAADIILIAPATSVQPVQPLSIF